MQPIDWTTIYSWPGYDFWGVILSLVGFIFSIGFAVRASMNAQRAAQAAESAKRSISKLDVITECSKVLRLFKEIRVRIDADEWDRVSELAEDVGVAISGVSEVARLEMSEESQEVMSDVLAQMIVMSRSADKHYHNQSKVDPVKVKAVLGKLSQKMASVVGEVKAKVEV